MKKRVSNVMAALWLAVVCVALIACTTSPNSYDSAENDSDQAITATDIQTTTTKGDLYKIVDTGQTRFFNNSRGISRPLEGEAFYGQDAEYKINPPSYIDNGDGTITDQVTGLMWQKSFEVMTYDQALKKLKTFNLADYSDWRLPTIKELYSIMMFSGVDVSSKNMSRTPRIQKPFLNTKYFDFKYGSNGRRIIDTQLLSSTIYRGRTMGGMKTVFGLNVADGRIKGYPLFDPRSRSGKKYTVRFVRQNPDYGKNNFEDNQDGTISDLATGLMWAQSDSNKAMSWKDALAWVQQKNRENHLNHNDWRLPNAKELQSIVDYSRSPQTTYSAAINPVFKISEILDEGGNKNYPFFWSSTTHESMRGGRSAVYISFGEALGFFKPPHSRRTPTLQDVHGAGAQRSDPKTGNPKSYPYGRGPQGDVIRIHNHVRLVRSL